MKIEYRGYTIQDNDSSNSYQKYVIFPSEDGPGHDYDMDDDNQYCGNCRWSDSIEDAKDTIDVELDDTEELLPGKPKKNWLVVLKNKVLQSDSFLNALNWAINCNAVMLVGKHQPEYQFI